MAYLMGYKSGSNYIMGRGNYSPASLAIESTPPNMRRGSSYTIGVFGIGSNLGAVSATYGGATVTVTAVDGSNVTILVPADIAKKHSLVGYPVVITLADVGSVTSTPIPLLPPVGWSFRDLLAPITTLNSIGYNASQALVTGDQVVFQTLSSPGHSGNGLSVDVSEDGYYGVNALGATVLPQTFSAYVIDTNGEVGTTAVKTIIDAEAPNILPNPFTLTAVNNAAVEQWITSNVVTIAGIDPAIDISATVTGMEQRVSTNSGSTWGAYTTSPINVQLGHQLQYRLFSSDEYATPLTGTANVGGVIRNFVVTTIAAPQLTLTSVLDISYNTVTPSGPITEVRVRLNATPANFSPTTVTYQVFTGGTWVTLGTATTPYEAVYPLADFNEGNVLSFRVTAPEGSNTITSNSPSITVRIPAVITLTGPTTVQSGNYSVTATFSKSVSFTSSPVFVLSGGGTITSVTGSGTTRTINISPPADAIGTITLLTSAFASIQDVYGVAADPNSGVTQFSVSYNTTSTSPTWVPSQPLGYYDVSGDLIPLVSTANIPYVVYDSGGVISGTRLFSGIVSTNSSGFLPTIQNTLLGEVGSSIQVVFKPTGRSIVIDGVVSDGGS
jgi:hypothetical protein